MEENRMCPIMSMSTEGFYDCSGERCAWWDNLEERCSVVTLAFAAAGLAVMVDDLLEDDESEED